MNLREPKSDDCDRIEQLVESAMTTSYQLSPKQIEAITADEFGADALGAKLDGETTIVRVAETTEDVDQPTVVGYVEGRVDDEWGELTWLFVDPEHRGRGIGTALFDTGRALLDDAGAEKLRGTTLDANAEGQDFFDHLGLEPAGDRRVEIGDQSLVEHVFVDPSADVAAATAAADEREQEATTFPETTTTGGTVTARTDDDQRLFVATDDPESGDEGPFFVTYVDEAHTEQHGYYCSNCGSLDVTMDSTDRLECQACGNAHASRSSEAYDGSYL